MNLNLQNEALFEHGNQLIAEGNLDAARRCFRQMIAKMPHQAEPYANLAWLLAKQGDDVTAEIYYRQAIALNPDLMEVHRNLGVLLMQQKRFTEADGAYHRALALDAESALVWSNLGVLRACQHREAEAENCFRTAMRLAPDNRQAQFNLSYVLLRQGRFKEGWLRLDARDNAALANLLPCPRWRGESIEGRHILVGIEAGHGDMIQFCRYASLLKDRGAVRVDMLCHPALKALLSSFSAIDRVIGLDEHLPEEGWDFWVPPLSLPHYCGTRLDNIPVATPYLAAPQAYIQKWQKRIPQSGFKVGLVWKGNPQFENDADRSLASLDLLAPLGEIHGVDFFSLQKGAGEEQVLAAPAGLNLQALGADIENFSDTAAIMLQLDLIISVDTAAVHLAGALGRPCWVLLPAYKTDWRWLTERSDSPWYPGTHRLFRQATPGDWTDTIADIKKQLARFLQE